MHICESYICLLTLEPKWVVQKYISCKNKNWLHNFHNESGVWSEVGRLNAGVAQHIFSGPLCVIKVIMERCSPSYLLKLSSLPPGRRAHFASCNDCLITSQVCDAKSIILPLQNKLEPCRSWKCGGSLLSKSRNSQSEWAEREASVIQMVHTFYTCSFDIAGFFSLFFLMGQQNGTQPLSFFFSCQIIHLLALNTTKAWNCS